jgi:hypothetical protein
MNRLSLVGATSRARWIRWAGLWAVTRYAVGFGRLAVFALRCGRRSAVGTAEAAVLRRLASSGECGRPEEAEEAGGGLDKCVWY